MRGLLVVSFATAGGGGEGAVLVALGAAVSLGIVGAVGGGVLSLVAAISEWVAAGFGVGGLGAACAA